MAAAPQVMLEADWRTGDGHLDLSEFVAQLRWHPTLADFPARYVAAKLRRPHVLAKLERWRAAAAAAAAAGQSAAAAASPPGAAAAGWDGTRVVGW